MSSDFTAVNDAENDEFQELLDNLPGLSPIVPGKRGGGRKATNNTGCDVLGVKMLEELKSNHCVDLSKRENVKGNTLYGIIDRNSVARATQISRNIKPSYHQVGVLAFSIARNAEKVIFLQLWKGTIVNGVLSFQKVYSDRKDYILQGETYDLEGNPVNESFWRTDKNGDKYSFYEMGIFVSFEDYLNAIAEVEEVPVSFPNEEVNRLKGLSEILANVNLNAEFINEDSELMDNDSELMDSEEDDEELEEEEV